MEDVGPAVKRTYFSRALPISQLSAIPRVPAGSPRRDRVGIRSKNLNSKQALGVLGLRKRPWVPAFAGMTRRGKRAGLSGSYRFAADSPLEGAGFEPSVPRERVCAFRDHVHSLQSVRRPLRRACRWPEEIPLGPLPFLASPLGGGHSAGGRAGRVITSFAEHRLSRPTIMLSGFASGYRIARHFGGDR
jgi:hypothetical protein